MAGSADWTGGRSTLRVSVGYELLLADIMDAQSLHGLEGHRTSLRERALLRITGCCEGTWQQGHVCLPCSCALPLSVHLLAVAAADKALKNISALTF